MNDTLFKRIALGIGMPLGSVQRLSVSAPFRYKSYSVPKRSGAGRRVIAQPAKEIKAIQRWLVSNELFELPVNPAATAYMGGSSIRVNALAHVKNRFLLKLDFAQFFPSIKADDIGQHVNRYLPDKYSDEELAALCRYLLWFPKSKGPLELCIGAPSSPFISNTLMYTFDCIVSKYAKTGGIIYTRYADDLSFSTDEERCLTDVVPFVRDQLRVLSYPALRLNERKTVFTSKKYRRSVTGLVLSSQGRVSLGRDKKRLISSMVHHFSLGHLDVEQSTRLCGLLAFANDVEPKFVVSLRRKYSAKTIEGIQTFAR